MVLLSLAVKICPMIKHIGCLPGGGGLITAVQKDCSHDQQGFIDSPAMGLAFGDTSI